jgi:UDP-N-acetylmuramate dehydrogenase
MKSKIGKSIIEKLRGLGITKTDEPLSNHTSFKTGGPADILIIPYSFESLVEIINIAGKKEFPVTLVGGCSNLLIGDRGIRGLVIKLGEDEEIKGRIEIKEDFLYADSSVKKSRFVSFCLENGFEGMEFMSGIPGCIGGGIIMNAGIAEAVFADILDSIVYMDKEGRIATMKVTGDMSRYRSLVIGRDVIVLGGYFRLNRTDNREKVKSKIDGYVEDRKMKHPLDRPSAGSVFKNPSGYSSWKLIDEAGLKGKRIGGAQVSELHTNFIINAGGAVSSDILKLIDHVREVVLSKTGILLETEIRIIGEF